MKMVKTYYGFTLNYLTVQEDGRFLNRRIFYHQLGP